MTFFQEKQMKNQGRKKIYQAFVQSNLRRCLCSATVSVAVFPLILILSLTAETVVEAYKIPGTFFAVVSAAFAFLFYYLKKQKVKKYYDGVVWSYLLFVQLFFTYFAQQSMVFYYAGVLLTAYLVYLSLGQYVILALGQLSCYVGLLVKSDVGQVAVSQLLLLTAVHLFAFLISRELYILKRDCVSTEKKLRREIRESEHDPLTGLLNWKGLERCVEEHWQTYRKRQETLAAFVIELDLFKDYNDQLGHAQGDVCLRRIAQAVADAVDGYGITARAGGAEFRVFAPDLSMQEAYQLAEQIRSRVENLEILRAAGSNQVMTVSIGLDIRYASEDVTVKGLYGRADRQLQQAKKDGRNCVRGSHHMREPKSRIG